MQAPRSPGISPNGARATARSSAAKKAEVGKIVEAWWKTVDEGMLVAIDESVLRNYN